LPLPTGLPSSLVFKTVHQAFQEFKRKIMRQAGSLSDLVS